MSDEALGAALLQTFLQSYRPPMFNVRYRKVGGLHFVRIGRLGFSFYVSQGV